MKTESKNLDNGDLQIILTFDEHDQICLNHDLLDIEGWYSSGPGFEKIQNCKKRMVSQYKEKLLSSKECSDMKMFEINELLQDDVILCKMISRLPEYKCRKDREAENI